MELDFGVNCLSFDSSFLGSRAILSGPAGGVVSSVIQLVNGAADTFMGGRTEFTFAFLLPARGKVFGNSLDDFGFSILCLIWDFSTKSALETHTNVRAQSWNSNGMLINRLAEVLSFRNGSP